MPSDLSNYLATRYLTADPKPTNKKRKRKQKDDSDGLIIAEDEAESTWRRGGQQGGSDDENAAVAGTSADFRKAKKSAWKVVGSSAITTPLPNSNPNPNTTNTNTTSTPDADADADAILASAAAEKALLGSASEDQPVMMSDGTLAGLQTGAAVSAQLEARRRRERADFERSGAKRDGDSETIYRDATGRRVDVSMKRAELRREAAAAAEKKAAAVEALKGDAQVAAAARRREELVDARTMAVARGVDDEEMNREMREQTRWGDTMAQFVGGKDGGGAGGGSVGGIGGKGGKRVKGKPVYQGAWTPNRYGIRPGYRWDGVDRGNGFEGERFKAINRRERNKGLEYSWQMDE
ncbi:Pre-mRNA-splicing factor of RES complex-domain-containing protein [Whalleya microplaca]|nr:Pre-mRNA-splicing factor of RES complex-domain-containing protein [Whalleya microplaca]